VETRDFPQYREIDPPESGQPLARWAYSDYIAPGSEDPSTPESLESSMSSEIPKKPSSSNNNNVFIALTAVMLLASGGLIWWKFAGSSSEEPVAATTAVSSTDQRTNDEPLPPPPPPPEEPSAVATAVTPTNAPVRSGKSVCPATCSGEVTAALKSALAGRGGSGRRCYEKSLSQNPLLKGKMTVHVRVGTNGSVCAANVSNDGLHEPGLTNCILGVFRSSVLPAPTNGCAEVDVPLNFVPNK
jgi:hypothetical protein